MTRPILRKNSQAAILWARNSISVLSQLNRKPLSANRTLNKSEHPTYTKAGCVHPAFDGSTESKKGLYEESVARYEQVKLTVKKILESLKETSNE